MKSVSNNQEDNKDSGVSKNDAMNQTADTADKKQISDEPSRIVASNDIEV